MSRVQVVVPASGINLGSGIDSVGLALALHNSIDMSLRATGEHRMVIHGESAYPTDGHPIIQAATALFEHLARPTVGLDIICESRIPPRCGLGDLAAWTIGALVAANNLIGLPAPREQIIDIACKLTDQPAAVITSLLGGLTITSGRSPNLLHRRVDVASLKIVLVVPTITGSDYLAKARQAIPEQVAFADLTFSVSRTALVIEALRKGDFALLGEAMQDRILEPRRTALLPGFAQAISAAKTQGAAAATLSGDGPAMLIFAKTNHVAIEKAVQNAFSTAEVSARTWTLNIDTQGIAINFQKS